MGGQAGWHYLTTADIFPLRRIVFSGQQKVSEATLRALLPVSLGDNLLRLNLHQLGERLKMHPWIKRAVLFRRLPDTLVIRVEERTPFALIHTGEAWLIDEEGYILAAPARNRENRYPHIQGLRHQAYAPGDRVTEPGLQVGLFLLKTFRHSPLFPGLMVTAIDVRSPQSPLLVWGDHQLTLRVGLDDLRGKLSLLPLITAYMARKGQEIAFIDLSLSRKIVVKPALVTVARE
ncbi:MAG: FtsQ-type POTRA domain-containing protein [Nitrospinota bacterium]|nr:MAG: FtsQ-type POTRA domain-containing protein [Nitrospinota bacterium]